MKKKRGQMAPEKERDSSRLLFSLVSYAESNEFYIFG